MKNRKSRSGILGIDDAALAGLIVALLTSFFGGGVAQERIGITDIIYLDVNNTKVAPRLNCKEAEKKYPKIII